MKRFEFDAVIHSHENQESGYIEFPYDFKTEFEGKGRVKIKAYFDDVLYRGSLVKMGMPCYFVGISQEIRKKIGKNPGDTVHVILEEDLEERTVTVPVDFLERLQSDAKAYDIFQKQSYTHKKEYVQSIESAKKPETRYARIEKAFEMLKEKIK